VGVSDLNDESILRLYGGIRDQVEADHRSKHKFMTGDAVKQHAAALREEMTRRRLHHEPIDWLWD
jgi:hypothetical protein